MSTLWRLRDSWILRVTTIILVCFGNAFSQVSYRITDLGVNKNSDNFSMVMGLNNQGWAENMDGVVNPPIRSTSTTVASGRAVINIHGLNIDLGTFGGDNSWTNYGGINDRGEAVGLSETSVPDPDGEDICAFHTKRTCRPFLWQDGHIHALPTLGGNNGQASAINNHGQIVGIAETPAMDPGCPPEQAWNSIYFAGILGKRRSPSSSNSRWRPGRLRTRHQRSRPCRRLLGNLHQHGDPRRIVGKRHCLPACRPRTRWKCRLRHQ